MNFVAETARSVAWISRVLTKFLGVRPITTAVLIAALFAEQVFTLIAFLLPLKVLILAGSDGVPRYFASFVSPDEKMPWIIGLSIGAVAAYLCSLVLQGISARLSGWGSEEVLEGAAELAGSTEQRRYAQNYYSDFCGLAANLLMLLLGLTVMALVDPTLTVVLIGLMLVEFSCVAVLLRFGNPLQPNPVLGLVLNRIQYTVSIFTSTNFLVGFFVLLIPYLQGSSRNILFSLLAVILLRRTMNALKSMVVDAVKLVRQREQIDPMVFRESKEQQRDRIVSRTLRTVFQKRQRERSIARALSEEGFATKDIRSDYLDFSIRNVYAFTVTLPHENQGEGLYLQHQVFPEKFVSRLEHEDYLFQYVGRSQLSASDVLARYSENSFYSQVLSFGDAMALDSDEWCHVRRELQRRLWCFQPPRGLIEGFVSFRSTLEGRLTSEYLERMTVALDYPDAIAAYEGLLRRLEDVKGILRTIPIHVHNPDVSRSHVVRYSENDYRIMVWQRWSIEHIGAEVISGLPDADIEEMLDDVSRARLGGGESLSMDHIRLARDCRAIEVAVSKDRFNLAIEHAQQILGNPLLN